MIFPFRPVVLPRLFCQPDRFSDHRFPDLPKHGSDLPVTEGTEFFVSDERREAMDENPHLHEQVPERGIG